MLGMERALARIKKAIDSRERIRIVTDYDVDGTTSSLILQQTLLRIGGKGLIDYHIPDRFVEGYGFSVQAAKRAAAEGIGLIITADIGVKDHEAVNAAADAGVDVIICDHHLPSGADVPDRAHAVLCPPQNGCTYPNKSLAACGVSLKLAQSLLDGHPRQDQLLYSMMKLAAIGTIADVVDISGLENRTIVSIGLEQLRTGRHAPGLQALLNVSNVPQSTVDTQAVGFRIAPRINAAGRLEGANAVVELLSERDPRRAQDLAENLDRLNEQRREIQSRLIEQCMQQLSDPPPDFAVLWGEESEGWHRGVVGIAAARVRDLINRPVAIISLCDDQARGSVRSTSHVHAVNALTAASDLLERFGGHPAAAGFSLAREQLPALRERLNHHAQQVISGQATTPTLELDMVCEARDITWEAMNALQCLEPYGKGNDPPLLLIRGVRPTQPRLISNGKHVKFQAGSLQALWWNAGQHIAQLNQPVDLAARPSINRWQGRTTLQLIVEDVRLAQP